MCHPLGDKSKEDKRKKYQPEADQPTAEKDKSAANENVYVYTSVLYLEETHPLASLKLTN